MIGSLTRLAGGKESVLVGPETADDAGVFRLGNQALAATADFITPVCDDPVRFGRVAAANSISDIYAMGGTPLFALNLCCFPKANVPDGTLTQILEGAASTLGECGAALIGGHSVCDDELKFGLAVVGRVSPDRILTNAGAQAGDALVLTKPLGTGVFINAFKQGKIDADALETALCEMERLNAVAAEQALAHDAHGATDITGFGLGGHAMEVAQASGVRLRLVYEALPVHSGFFELVKSGVTTGSTRANRANVEAHLTDSVGLDAVRAELLHDPQTSGGLLVSLPASQAEPMAAALCASGHTARVMGDVLDGPVGIEIV